MRLPRLRPRIEKSRREGRGRLWFLVLAIRDPRWGVQELAARVRGRYRPGLVRLAPDNAGRSFGPLTDPPAVAASEASLSDDEIVLGVALGAEARAYPRRLIGLPHVVNDVVGGRPVVVVLCVACDSAVALDPVVGRRLTFDIRHIYEGNVAIRDRQTRSNWAPFSGQAIKGRLRGQRLQLLPLWQTDWKAWRELHPRTDVVLEGQEWGKVKPIGDARLNRFFAESLSTPDRRLPHNALVLGVITPSARRAYPLTVLETRRGVLNDEVDGEQVVVLGIGTVGAAAFSRVVGDRTLSFEAIPGGARDRETGTRWSREGRAVEGPLAGHRLRFLPSHVADWYGWAAQFPGIGLFTEGTSSES